MADAFVQRGEFDFQPEAAPDVVKTLLDKMFQQVPWPAHRAAGLSFIEGQREGLFPHDLAREALETDLHWRNPEWHTELLDLPFSTYRRHLKSGVTGLTEALWQLEVGSTEKN